MSGRARIILTAAVSFVVLLAFFFAFVQPRRTELGEVRSRVEAEEARTTQLTADLAHLKDLRSNAPQLQAQLDELRSAVPSSDEIPELLLKIEDVASRADVDFVQITPEIPAPPAEDATVAQVNLAIGAEGSYFSLQDFVRRLYEMDRALRIDYLTMSGGQEDSGTAAAGETGATGASGAVTTAPTITLQMNARIFFTPSVSGAATGAPAGTGTPATPGATPAPTASPAPSATPAG